MAAFRFRLAKILKLRERAEQDAARVLGRVLARRQACLNRMEEMRDNRERLAEKRNELQRGRVAPKELSQNRYQMIILEKGLALEERKLRLIESEEDAARKVLLERSRERKLLEKLEERQRLEFQEAERRRELREQDERPASPGPSGMIRGMGVAMNAENAHTR